MNVRLARGTIANAMGVEMGMTEPLRLMQNYDGTKEGLRGILKGLLRHPERINEEQPEERHRQSLLRSRTRASPAQYPFHLFREFGASTSER